MSPPSLPDALLRLMPPHAPDLLAGLWRRYQKDLLRDLWFEVPEDPDQDWRMVVLIPPFPDPDPAPIPPPPLEPSPDLWLAWSSPSLGVVEPLLLRSVGVPCPTETLELRHSVSGWSLAPTMVGHPLALDHADADPIIRCLHHHQGGVWEDPTPVSE